MSVTLNLQTVAFVLAAHGDRGEALEQGRANSMLLTLCDQISDAGDLGRVFAGVLKGEPRFEEALAAAATHGAERIFVYPFFMADGYFVRSVLPSRIQSAGLACPVDVLPPLGLEPELDSIIISDAEVTALSAGYEPMQSRLLVVGHGSQIGPASANATRLVAERLAARGRFLAVETAFLEEAPFLDEALVQSRLPTVVAGFFSGDGLHASEDVPAAIRSAGAAAVYVGPVGRSPAIPGLILKRLRAAMNR